MSLHFRNHDIAAVINILREESHTSLMKIGGLSERFSYL